MEDIGSQDNESNVSQLFIDYAESLTSLTFESKLSSLQVISILRSRDRLQAAISEVSQLDDNYLAKLVELDIELKQHSDVICNAENLSQLRQSLHPPESYWWWYLEPSAKNLSVKPSSDKFDWLWNIGTVACLVLATSLMTQTAKAFSAGGFDFLGTLSTIGQGAGLAFVAGGALTDKGKKTVTGALSSLRIPESLHAEVTLGASLVLLGAAYGINSNLPLVGNWYFEQGQSHEKRGEWGQAFDSYKRALNFSPDDYRSQISTGFLYEKLGNFDKAIDEYKKGTSFGIPEFLNAQARAMVMGALQKNSWQGGIDIKIINEAEDLLVRASKSTEDLSSSQGKFTTNPRLKADININRAIAKTAKIKYVGKIDEGKLDSETKSALNEITDDLLRLQPEPNNLSKSPDLPEEKNLLTTASTIGKSREECFYQRAFLVGALSGASTVNGVDYPATRFQEQDYDCSPFYLNKLLSTTPDAFLLNNNYLLAGWRHYGWFEQFSNININSLMEFLYSPRNPNLKFASSITLVQESDTWLRLANQLSQSIKNSDVKIPESYYIKNCSTDCNKNIVWRILLNKDEQIIAFFAYDEISRRVGLDQPFIKDVFEKKLFQQVISKLTDGEKLEFVDLKVVLSLDGKILHLLPWHMAYSTALARCKEECGELAFPANLRSVFADYTPDFNDPAEIGALQAMLTTNTFELGVATQKGVYYAEPAIFKLKVSADGQIVGYEAINQVAIQRLEKKIPFPTLQLPQFPELEKKTSYGYFKIEFNGLFYKISPWSDSK